VVVTDRADNETGDDWLVYVEPPVEPLPPDNRQASIRASLRVDGASPGDRAGTSVVGLGDINGDGRGDFAVGAPRHDANARTDAGSVFVVYGRAGGTSVDLANFSEQDGYRIDGAGAGDLTGSALGVATDMTGDGAPELVIGAPHTRSALDALARGKVWIVFGGTQTNVDLAALGERGYRIDGPAEPFADVVLARRAKVFGDAIGAGVGASQETGFPADRGDDVNGDGRSDIVLGASAHNEGAAVTDIRPRAGSTYVIYGKSDSRTVDTGNLTGRGFRIVGAAANDLSGYSVANLGDVHDDDRADLAVGAPGRQIEGRDSAGTTYVVFGATESTTVDLAALGARGYRVHGQAGDQLGLSTAALGDVDSDGRNDFATAGRAAYVSFGKADTDVREAQTVEATGARIGGRGADLTVASAGDQDGDGTPDLVVGSPDVPGGGSSWLVLGTPYGASRTLSALGGQEGYRLSPDSTGDALGASGEAVGMAFGQNSSDQAFAAPGASPKGRSDSGSVFVVAGEVLPTCAEGIQATDVSADATLGCVEGSNQVLVNEDDDDEPERVLVSDYPVSPALGEPTTLARQARAAQSEPSKNIKTDKRDTAVEGVVHRKGVEWYLFRTGVTLRFDKKGRIYELGRVRLHSKVVLRGNTARHGGFIRILSRRSKSLQVKPRIFGSCEQRTGRKSSRCYIADTKDNTLDTFFVDQGRYLTPGQTMQISTFIDRNHRGPGSFRWNYTYSGLLQDPKCDAKHRICELKLYRWLAEDTLEDL